MLLDYVGNFLRFAQHLSLIYPTLDVRDDVLSYIGNSR